MLSFVSFAESEFLECRDYGLFPAKSQQVSGKGSGGGDSGMVLMMIKNQNTLFPSYNF